MTQEDRVFARKIKVVYDLVVDTYDERRLIPGRKRGVYKFYIPPDETELYLSYVQTALATYHRLPYSEIIINQKLRAIRRQDRATKEKIELSIRSINPFKMRGY